MAKILVVEDSNFQRKVIVKCLQDMGYDVCEAADGQLGLQAVGSESPDFIIVDVAMPNVDGLEMMKTLRSQGNATPFAVLTSDIGTQTKEEFTALEAKEFINKPIDKTDLAKRLAQHIK